MQQVWTSLILLTGVMTVSCGEVTVAPCKDPMPTGDEYNFSVMVENEYEYIFTPNQMKYYFADNIKQSLKRTDQREIYDETIEAHTPTGLGNKILNFMTKDIGNGMLQRTKGDKEYFFSILSVVDDLVLMYVCSPNAGVAGAEDALYVLANSEARVAKKQNPYIIFKDVLGKYNFNTHFLEMPRKHLPTR